MANVLLLKSKNESRFSSSQPPLELLSVAGYVRKFGHNVKLIDFSAENKKLGKADLDNIDFVLVAFYVLNRSSALELIKNIKAIKKDVKIAVGTIFCEDSFSTTLWEHILCSYPEIDMCIIGEPETAFLKIANGEKLENIPGIAFKADGKIVKNDESCPEADLDNFGMPAWDLVVFSLYKSISSGIHNGIDLSKEITIPVRFSRGCIGSCKYCALWWMWKNTRTRSGKKMAEELMFLNKQYGLKNFEFRDDCFGMNIKAVEDFCEEIKKSGIKIAFSVSSRVDVLKDERILQTLREAGCYKILYGVETGSQLILDEFNKKIKVKDMKETLLKAKKVGYAIHALLIIGSPKESVETINETIDFLEEVKPDSISAAGGIMLMPGTAYYNQAKARGYIDDNFWLSKKECKIDNSVISKFKIFVFSKAVRNRKKIKDEKEVYSLMNILQYGAVQILHALGLRFLSEFAAVMILEIRKLTTDKF